MSGAPVPPPAITTSVVVFAIVLFIMVRRTYALSQGTPYSEGRIFTYGAFSALVFVVLAGPTVYVAYGSWGIAGLGLIGAYAAAVVVSALVAEPRVRRLVRFEERADGRVYFRLPILIPVLTLVLFVVRVAVGVAVFGLASLFTLSFPTTLPIGQLLILIGVDLLYGASIGLLFGRGFAVRRAYLERSAAARPLSGAG
jgi:hypothetical protein